MTFTELADTRENITSALLNLSMVKYFVECSTADKAYIHEILDYCELVTQTLEEAEECLQTAIDNILKAEGYNNDNM